MATSLAPGGPRLRVSLASGEALVLEERAYTLSHGSCHADAPDSR